MLRKYGRSTLHRQPDLGRALARIEHSIHCRQVRRGEPISPFHLANSEYLPCLVMAEINDDHGSGFVEFCGDDW